MIHAQQYPISGNYVKHNNHDVTQYKNRSPNSINYHRFKSSPQQYPSFSSLDNNAQSQMTQMIPLPPLLNTNTNINTSTSTSTQMILNRKRNATQMMDQVSNAECIQPTRSKRQKIDPKISKNNNNNHKLAMAVQILTNFADQHAGKLPSLRYIMKMLKVGFPKAHEIIDTYAKQIGKTKDEVMADMTVRQENEKKSGTHNTYYKKHKTKKYSTPKKVKNDKNFSRNLRQLLEIVSCDENWDIFERNYLWNMHKLELFIDKITENELLSCVLEDKVNIASAYYILSETYYKRCNKHIAYKYIKKALNLFKKCNRQYDEDIDIDIDSSSGIFWKEIVNILVLGGDILLDFGDLNGSQNNFELAYNLVCKIKRNGDQNIAIEIKNEYLWKCLEKLSIIHCHKKEYNLSVKYGKLFLNIMQNKINIKNSIETKAYISCNLMLCSDVSYVDEGYKYYKNVLRESINMMGENDVFTIGQMCYFSIHFIRTNCEWNETHQLINKLLDINENYLNNEIKEEINCVFVDYVNFLNKKQLFVDNYYKNKINNIMGKLHYKHIKLIKDINLKARIKQNEYKKINKTLKNTNENEENIALVLNNKFSYDINKEYNDLYPKIDIIQVLIAHISLLINIQNFNFANKILNELVIKHAKCLNKFSQYLEHFPISKINEKQINSLLNLL